MRHIYGPIYPVKPYERGISETLGKYTGFVMPGLGFQIPVVHMIRVRDIREHTMHSEYLEVPDGTVQAIERTRQRGGRVIAVGTTVVRSLESAALDGQLAPFQGETDIFIYPGYRFQVIDGLITNFHLPESTLLMLVSAFAGYEPTMAAYRHAVEQRYRFFSYGDAMFVLPKKEK